MLRLSLSIGPLICHCLCLSSAGIAAAAPHPKDPQPFVRWRLCLSSNLADCCHCLLSRHHLSLFRHLSLRHANILPLAALMPGLLPHQCLSLPLAMPPPHLASCFADTSPLAPMPANALPLATPPPLIHLHLHFSSISAPTSRLPPPLVIQCSHLLFLLLGLYNTKTC